MHIEFFPHAPLICAQMNNFNVFSYMDSSFMHTFEDKLKHVRPLRAADFAEVESTFEAGDLHEINQPDPDPSPPKLLVRTLVDSLVISLIAYALPLDRVEAGVQGPLFSCPYCLEQY